MTKNCEDNSYSILLVDDNDNNLQIAAKIMNNAGYRVFIASDGKSALEILETITPDVILLDIMMPGMSGLDVCKKMKEKPELSSVPIIFLSAIGEDSEIEQGLEIGGSDYIVKPFSERVLLARVRLQLEIGRYERKIEEKNHELLIRNKELTEMQEQLLQANEALEKQIEKNLAVFASMNDMIRNPLSVVMAMLDMKEDDDYEKIIRQLQKIDNAVDDMDKGFLDSDKVRSFLKKHYHING